MVEIFSASLVGIASVFTVIVIAEWTVRKQLRQNTKGNGDLIEYSQQYRIGCVVFALGVLFSFYPLFANYADPSLAGESVRFLWFLTTLPLSWYLVLEAFTFKARLEDDGLRINTLRGEKFVRWMDVTTVKWVESWWAFQLNTSSDKVRLSVFALGIELILHRVRTHSPGADISEAQDKLDELRGN